MTAPARHLTAALTLAALLVTSTALAARPADAIRQTVRRHHTQLAACYESALEAAPGLEGRLVVAFTIAPTGDVSTARAESSTLAAPALERCVLAAVRGWTFGAAPDAGDTKVSYPFRFRPGHAIVRAF